MNMFAAFLTRKEEESEAFFVEDSWTHVLLICFAMNITLGREEETFLPPQAQSLGLPLRLPSS